MGKILAEARIVHEEVERPLQVLKDKRRKSDIVCRGNECEDNGCGGDRRALDDLERFFSEYELLPLPQAASNSTSLTRGSLDLRLDDSVGVGGWRS